MHALWGLNDIKTTWVGKPLETVKIQGGSTVSQNINELELDSTEGGSIAESAPPENPHHSPEPDAKQVEEEGEQQLEEANANVDFEAGEHGDPEAEAIASTKLQSAYRGRRGREKALQKKQEKMKIEAEEGDAATKVQKIYRGNQGRKLAKEKTQSIEKEDGPAEEAAEG